MRWIDDEKLRELTLAGRVDASANHARWKEREVSNIEFIAGAPTRKDGETPKCRLGPPAPFIRLPWPPKTGNTAYRTATNKATGKVIHYLDSAVKAYRQSVAVLLGRTEQISGTYEMHMDMSPPDARTRDIDNALKIVLDSLKGAWLPDDSMAYMRKLVVTVNDERRGEIAVRALTDREAA